MACRNIAAFVNYLIIIRHAIQPLYQVVLKVFEHGEEHASFAHEMQAFIESAYIAYPVKDTVNVAIDLVER